MRRATAALPLALALTGCATQALHALPSELRRHAGELGATGHARVHVLEGSEVELAATREVDVELPGARHWFGLVEDAPELRRVTAGELVRACDAPGASCLADQVRNQPLEVGQRRRVDGGKLARGLGLGIGAGFVVACVAACDDPGLAAGTAALVVGYLLLAGPLSAIASVGR